MYLTKNENKLSEDFIRDGFLILKVNQIESLNFIRGYIEGLIYEKISSAKNNKNILNEFHRYIKIKEINNFRLDFINSLNSESKIRYSYFDIAKFILNDIVGNELAMQTKINLSIQLPKDKSSLLPVHADTWAGDSPYEVVIWIPLVDCYKTKSMFILPQQKAQKITENFKNLSGQTAKDFYNNIENDLEWLSIPFGHIMIFNQSLPHGNVVNIEKETRWSMNCRFKSVFSPYGDKKLGEFFEPITLRAASRLGMSYKYPKIK